MYIHLNHTSQIPLVYSQTHSHPIHVHFSSILYVGIGILLGVVLHLAYKITSQMGMFPHPGGSLPFFGNMFQVPLVRYVDAFGKWHRALGDTYEAAFMYFKYVDSTDPKIIEQVMHSYDRDDLYKYSLSEVMGVQSVILSDGDLWKAQRKLINPCFSINTLKELCSSTDFLCAPGEALIRRLASVSDSGKPFEIDHEFVRSSLATVGKVLFGHDFGYCNSNIGDPDAKFVRMLWDGMFEYNERLMNPLRKYTNPAAIWRFNSTIAEIKGTIGDLIKKRKTEGLVDAQGRDRKDVLSVLLKTFSDTDSNSFRMNDQELADNMNTLMLAGHETTAHALSYCLWELSQNPDCEAKLVSELQKLGDREITYDDIQGPGLQYTSMVVQESLRLHPVAPSIMRKWNVGQTLGEITCTEECTVGVTLTEVHMDERLWPEPSKFKPERFLPEVAQKRPKTAYLPFGGGPRACAGKRLALLELKYFLALLYRKYSFAKVPGFEYKTEITVTMHEIHGMPMFVTSRKPAAALGPSL